MNYKIKILLPFLILSLLVTITSCERERNLNLVTSPVTQGTIVWQPQGLDSCNVFSLLFDANGNLFAGTNRGLYKSTDVGDNWNRINQDISSSAVTCLSAYTINVILAGTASKGVFLSTDDGNTWQNLGLSGIRITSIAFDSQGKIFAGTQGNGIYYYSGNEDWNEASLDLSTQTFPSMMVTPQNTIFAGGTGIYRSDDDGKTWNLKNNGLGNWSVYALISDINGNIDAGTDMGGFFRSTDNGETWKQLNSGLTNTEVLSLVLDNNGNIFAGTWRGGIFRSSDNGNSWASVDSGLIIQSVSSLGISNDNYLFAGTFKGVFRTTVSLDKISP